MDLTNTNLSPDVVEALLAFNIRDVPSFLSYTIRPKDLISMALVLKMSADEVRDLADGLRKRYPALAVTDANCAHYLMGHRSPPPQSH